MELDNVRVILKVIRVDSLVTNIGVCGFAYQLLENRNFVLEGLIVLNSAFLHCLDSHFNS